MAPTPVGCQELFLVVDSKIPDDLVTDDEYVRLAFKFADEARISFLANNDIHPRCCHVMEISLIGRWVVLHVLLRDTTPISEMDCPLDLEIAQ